MSSSTEQVKGFDTEELINFLKGRNLHLNETHYNVFRHKEIAGSDFLNYTREELKGLGLETGPTKRIEQLINELNTQNVLKKEVEVLDTEGLINFLKGRQNLHLNEAHYNILRHKEIAGSDFLNYTKKEFEGFGLKSGPAKRLEQLVNELNNQIILNLWTSAEDNRLVTAVNRFGSRNWDRIARKMGNRNPIECQRRWNLINFNANRSNRLYLNRNPVPTNHRMTLEYILNTVNSSTHS